MVNITPIIQITNSVHTFKPIPVRFFKPYSMFKRYQM